MTNVCPETSERARRAGGDGIGRLERDREMETVARALADARVVAVFGPRGIGKTTFLRALPLALDIDSSESMYASLRDDREAEALFEALSIEGSRLRVQLLVLDDVDLATSQAELGRQLGEILRASD